MCHLAQEASKNGFQKTPCKSGERVFYTTNRILLFNTVFQYILTGTEFNCFYAIIVVHLL